jgi:uncharacterized delta-60 repeat protein
MTRTAGDRVRPRQLVAIASLVLVAALPSASALAAGGRLDQSFGDHGRVLVSQVSDGFDPLFAAAAPGAKIVVATRSKLVRIDSRGRLDRSFGGDGVVDLPVATGTELTLSGLAVDKLGRVVIAGTSAALDAPYPKPQAAVVERLLGDGELDPSFAGGGRFESTLGLPPAPAYGAPTVTAAGLALDARGRPLVAGSFVTETRSCETYMGTFYGADAHQGFLARLTQRGKLDPSFAGGGVHAAGTPTLDSLPLVDRAGRTTYGEAVSDETFSPTGCPQRGISAPIVLQGLDPSGSPRTGFDAQASRTALYARAAAQDSRMRTLMLGGSLDSLGMWGAHEEEVVRVEPSGASDRHFGVRGRVAIADVDPDAEATVTAIAVDPRNRVVLAGTSGRSFHLLRLNARGEADTGFGGDGSVQTRFGSWSADAAAVAIDSRGRLVVVGSASPRGSYSSELALSRYLPGSGHHRKAHHRDGGGGGS